MRIENAASRLADLGHVLPPPVTPIGSYLSAVLAGDMLFVGAHGPLRSNGSPLYQGRVGREFNAEQAGIIAVGAALNVLASAQRSLGSLDLIEKVVKVTIFVVCDDDSVDLAEVCAPALEMLSKVFKGAPAAMLANATSLPNNVPVFIELIASVFGGEQEPSRKAC